MDDKILEGDPSQKTSRDGFWGKPNKTNTAANASATNLPAASTNASATDLPAASTDVPDTTDSQASHDDEAVTDADTTVAREASAEPVVVEDTATEATPQENPAPSVVDAPATPKPRRAFMAATLPSPEDDAPVPSPVSPVVTQPVAAPSNVDLDVAATPSLESSISLLRSDAPAMPYMNTVEQVEETRRSGRGKVIVALVCVLMVVLAAVYVVVANHFTTHFFPNTTVNGEDVSGMSVDDLSANVTSIGAAYKTQVVGQGIDLTVAGADIAFTYDGQAYGKDAASQIHAWSWPLELSRPHAYTVQQGISYDEARLAEIVGTTIDKFNETAQQPTNATMVYDESAGKFDITPDAVGTALRKEDVVNLALSGVSTMQDEVRLTEDLLVQPTVTKDNEQLNATTKKANGLLEKSIVLRAAGNDVHTVDKNLLASWIGINEELNLAINHEAIVQWAQGPLSAQIDTKGTKRAYTRPDGKQIEVEGSSWDYDYGWCLDGAALGDILTDHLYNSVADPIDMPMKQSAASWNPGGQDWGNRYIDVDLSEQHVRMYDDSSNVIWETDCVSGNPIYGGGTQTGVYFIYDKESPMELVGLDYDGDGTPDYRTWVTYWMPFDGGEGLHDMATRGAFGGNIYTYNGSHGCVNLPYGAAEQLFGITNVGDVVIVHW